MWLSNQLIWGHDKALHLIVLQDLHNMHLSYMFWWCQANDQVILGIYFVTTYLSWDFEIRPLPQHVPRLIARVRFFPSHYIKEMMQCGFVEKCLSNYFGSTQASTFDSWSLKLKINEAPYYKATIYITRLNTHKELRGLIQPYVAKTTIIGLSKNFVANGAPILRRLLD